MLGIFALLVVSPGSCQSSFLGLARAALERPFLLSFAFTVVRLVVHPYLGLVHDAQLYALQVQNRAMSLSYAADLYFAYGSQDQYSLFSPLVSPLASFAGVSAAFAIFHLTFSWLMIFAMCRLIPKIVPHVGAAFVSIAMLSGVDVTYGGWSIFQVHEPFLTPRLPACALVLLAMDASLAQRWVFSAIFVLLAMSLHPIMALGGAAVLVLMLAWQRWGGRAAAAIAGAGIIMVAFAFLMGMTGWIPLMSASWVETTRAISPQCFPSEWKFADGLNIAAALLVTLLAWNEFTSSGRSLLLCSWVVGLGGLAASLAAEWLPMAIVIQAQTMRSLWIPQYLAVPAALLASLRLLSLPGWTSVALSSACLLWAARAISIDLLAMPVFWVVILGCGALGYMVSGWSRSANAQWHRTGFVGGIWIGATLGHLALVVAMTRLSNTLQEIVDPFSIIVLAARASGSALVVTAALGLAWALLFSTRPRAAWFVTLSLAVAVLSARAWTAHTVDRDSIDFVRARLDVRPRAMPTVYWPTDVMHIWLGLPARSFCHFAQVQGAVFREELADEARCRLRMTRNIEHRVMREKGIGDLLWERLERVHGPFARYEPVTPATVEAILSPGGADYVILPFPLSGLEGVSNGKVWVYERQEARREEHARLHAHHKGI